LEAYSRFAFKFVSIRVHSRLRIAALSASPNSGSERSILIFWF
jgi:hypothetical protein